MKRLLEEKNAAMERMKRKLDEARAAGRGAATADRSEAARLTDRQEGGRGAIQRFVHCLNCVEYFDVGRLL